MLKFTKMQGLGNDYVYIFCSNEEEFDFPTLSKKVSNRNFGIGSDGLIVISYGDNKNYKMRIFNADGSEAKMCGNGIRCVAKYLYDEGYVKEKNFIIETNSGKKKVEVFVDENDEVSQVEISMGKATIIKSKNVIFQYETFPVTFVDIGNLHGVIFVKGDTEFYAKKYGKQISDKYDINVEFVQILNSKAIKLSVYERGSGITMACGTGASASYFTAFKNNLVERNGKVYLAGGILEINILEGDILMKGEAKKVFDGIFY